MADPSGPGAVETHTAVLFSLDERVFKLKKRVDLGFLDFTTVERRRDACRREVELNRRLAADVYLGVAEVRDPDGEVCEHLVVMRRLPAERSLEALAAHGAAEAGDRAREVADVLAGFHAAARRPPDVAGTAGTAARKAQWRADVEALQQFDGDPLDGRLLAEAGWRAQAVVEHRDRLFERRIAEDRVVDGHGDLLADDVFCLDDGPRLLDCVEFDDRLRHVDGLDDAAALVMDLEQLGHADLAAAFLHRYAERTGDPVPPLLLHLFVAHRAAVRAKAACLRHRQGEDAAADRARGLLDTVVQRLRRATPRVVLVGGPPASGTSTVARGVADRTGATLLSSDRIRKELAGADPDAPAPSDGPDLYTREHTRRTYDELCDRAVGHLGAGESVVLDASWTRAEHRSCAVDAAGGAGAEVVALWCATDRETAAARAAARGPGPSDAGPGTVRRLSDEADAWPDAHTVDTGGAPRDAVAQAMTVLER